MLSIIENPDLKYPYIDRTTINEIPNIIVNTLVAPADSAGTTVNLTIGASSNVVIEANSNVALYMASSGAVSMYNSTYDTANEVRTDYEFLKMSYDSSALTTSINIPENLNIQSDIVHRAYTLGSVSTYEDAGKQVFESAAVDGFRFLDQAQFDSDVSVKRNLFALSNIYGNTLNVWAKRESTENPDLDKVGYGMRINEKDQLEFVKYARYNKNGEFSNITKRVAVFGLNPLKDTDSNDSSYLAFDALNGVTLASDSSNGLSFATSVASVGCNMVLYGQTAMCNLLPLANNQYSLGSDNYGWNSLYMSCNASIHLGLAEIKTVSSNTSDLQINGNLLPSQTLTYDLGSPDFRWRDLYLSGNTIFLGEANNISTDNNGDVSFTNRENGLIGLKCSDLSLCNLRLREVDGKLVIQGQDGTLMSYLDLNNTGTSTMMGGLVVSGPLTVNGSTTSVNTTNMVVNDNMITINSNLSGVPNVFVHSGIEVNRGTNPSYYFLFDEVTDLFKIGLSNGSSDDLQAVCTRDSTMTAGYPYFDASSHKLVDRAIQMADVTGLVSFSNAISQSNISLSNSYYAYSNASATSISALQTKASATSNDFYHLNAYYSDTGVINGSLLPSQTITYNLGSPEFRWKDLYLAGNTIFLGESNNISTDNNGAISFANSNGLIGLKCSELSFSNLKLSEDAGNLMIHGQDAQAICTRDSAMTAGFPYFDPISHKLIGRAIQKVDVDGLVAFSNIVSESNATLSNSYHAYSNAITANISVLQTKADTTSNNFHSLSNAIYSGGGIGISGGVSSEITDALSNDLYHLSNAYYSGNGVSSDITDGLSNDLYPLSNAYYSKTPIIDSLSNDYYSFSNTYYSSVSTSDILNSITTDLNDLAGAYETFTSTSTASNETLSNDFYTFSNYYSGAATTPSDEFIGLSNAYYAYSNLTTESNVALSNDYYGLSNDYYTYSNASTESAVALSNDYYGLSNDYYTYSNALSNDYYGLSNDYQTYSNASAASITRLDGTFNVLANSYYPFNTYATNSISALQTKTNATSNSYYAYSNASAASIASISASYNAYHDLSAASNLTLSNDLYSLSNGIVSGTIDLKCHALSVSNLKFTEVDNKLVVQDKDGNYTNYLDLNSTANSTLMGGLVVSGSLAVLGTVSTVNTANLDVSDNMIVINKDLVGVPSPYAHSGFEINRGTESNYFLVFDEETKLFKFGLSNSSSDDLHAVTTRHTNMTAGYPYFDPTSQNLIDRAIGMADVTGLVSFSNTTVQDITSLSAYSNASAFALTALSNTIYTLSNSFYDTNSSLSADSIKVKSFGTSNDPSFSFSNSSNMGMFAPTATSLGFSCEGSNIIKVTRTDVQMAVPVYSGGLVVTRAEVVSETVNPITLTNKAATALDVQTLSNSIAATVVSASSKADSTSNSYYTYSNATAASIASISALQTKADATSNTAYALSNAFYSGTGPSALSGDLTTLSNNYLVLSNDYYTGANSGSSEGGTIDLNSIKVKTYGTSNAPTFSFSNSSNMGMYAATSTSLGFSCEGSNIIKVTKTDVQVAAPIFSGGLVLTRATYISDAGSPITQVATVADVYTLSNDFYTFSNTFSGAGVGGVSSQWTTSNANIYFSTISNSEFVGIGTSSPGYKLEVNGDIYASKDILAASDYRFKKDFELVEDALYKVCQLNGYTYTRSDTDDPRRYIGLIAQEVQEVIPEAVSEREDGYLALAYGNLAALFVESIKVMKERIEDLEARLV